METIILSGCGGGYDIMACLPLYYELKDKYNVVLCNLSFSSDENFKNIGKISNEIIEICDCCYEINPGSYADDYAYFPEYKISNQLNHKVYAMCKYDTVNDIITFYDSLLKIYGDIQKIYLCDAGCDVLLNGSETELATPVEDWMHFKAVMLSKINKKYVCALGLNVDCGHGVIETELIERLNFMRKNDMILHEEIFDLSDDKVKYYCDIFTNCNPEYSIVHSFVMDSLNGKSGYVIPECAKSRIGINTTVFVGNLTKTFIVCDAQKLYDDNYFMERLSLDMSSDEFDKMLYDNTYCYNNL